VACARRSRPRSKWLAQQPCAWWYWRPAPAHAGRESTGVDARSSVTRSRSSRAPGLASWRSRERRFTRAAPRALVAAHVHSGQHPCGQTALHSPAERQNAPLRDAGECITCTERPSASPCGGARPCAPVGGDTVKPADAMGRGADVRSGRIIRRRGTFRGPTPAWPRRAGQGAGRPAWPGGQPSGGQQSGGQRSCGRPAGRGQEQPPVWPHEDRPALRRHVTAAKRDSRLYPGPGYTSATGRAGRGSGAAQVPRRDHHAGRDFIVLGVVVGKNKKLGKQPLRTSRSRVTPFPRHPRVGRATRKPRAGSVVLRGSGRQREPLRAPW